MKHWSAIFLLGLGLIGTIGCEDRRRDENPVERGAEELEEGTGDLERKADDLGD